MQFDLGLKRITCSSLLTLFLLCALSALVPSIANAQSINAATATSTSWSQPSLGRLTEQFSRIAAPFDQQQAYERGIAKAYLEIPQNLRPELIKENNKQLWMDTFTENYIADTSGLWSVGPTGPTDTINYTVVNSAQGGIAPILDLVLWPIDPLQYGITIPTPLGTTVECFIHSARFGPTDKHVGYAIQFDDGFKSMLIFMPLTMVSDSSLITADQAAAFIAFVATDGMSSQPFLEWAVENQQSMTVDTNAPSSAGRLYGRLDNENHSESLIFCDMDSLKQCLTEAAASYSQDLTEAHNKHKSRINEILKEFGDGAKVSLGGYVATGAVGGAIVGVAGGPLTAAIGALTGVIAGGVGWLVDTALSADQAQEKVDAADAKYQEARCSAVKKAANAWKNCFAEHCPEYYETVCREMDQVVAESGCK